MDWYRKLSKHMKIWMPVKINSIEFNILDFTGFFGFSSFQTLVYFTQPILIGLQPSGNYYAKQNL
jgi:hypothetical protein